MRYCPFMAHAALEPVLDQIRAEPSRTWSIIVTLFGDAIQPRGGSVWLGTLLAFFARLDIAGGVVRTAVSRLAADGWLARNRVGRNSFYHLGEHGSATFRNAATRIYRAAPPRWGGHFDLLLLDSPDPGGAALLNAGFASPAPQLWIAPAGAIAPETPGALTLQITGDPAMLRELAARAWPLDKLASAYAAFIAAFNPLRTSLIAGETLTDEEAMLARILLIHQYRRIVLTDPALPAAVLPPDWPGATARALCAELYPRLLDGSERWLDKNGITEQGPLPPPTGLAARFQ
jgi:phenylacetic acid degradation operon negative regulatory protein